MRAGPATWYVLEGEAAQSTPAGITRYRTGDIFVNPVGTPFEISVVGNSPGRFLVLQLFPAGETGSSLPNVQLPSPFTAGAPTVLPRTGERIEPDFETGLKRHQLLEAILRASETGQRQTL